MTKKIFALILCVVMGLSVMAGCSLVTEDTDAVNGQIIAEVQPKTFVLSDGSSWTSPHLKVTRKELIDYFMENAYDYLESHSREEILDAFAERLRNNMLLEVYLQKEIAEGNLSVSQKEINDAWKKVYVTLDSRVYDEMEKIADSFDEDAPVKPDRGTDADEETTYPVDGDNTEDESDDLIETPWRADPTPADQMMRLQAVRNLLSTLIGEVEAQSYNLTEEEKQKLQEDKDFYASVKNLKLTESEVLNLYPNLQDRFCVRYLYFDDEYESLQYASLKKSVEDQADTSVTVEELTKQYDLSVAGQKSSYSTLAAYTSALDSAKSDSVIAYRPTDVKQYYVKHILVPFSDEQKKEFASNSTSAAVQGLSKEQLQQRRNNEADRIKSYEHRDGEDYGNALTIGEIRNDILSQFAPFESVKQGAGSVLRREQTFRSLIYKYNTDEGIFGNDVGYGLRYGESSSYMPEFEKAATELYEEYQKTGYLGGVKECVTDYGVHFLMLSSVYDGSSSYFTSTGTLGINDYYNVMQRQTIGEYLKDKMINAKKTTAYTSFTNLLTNQLLKDYNDVLTTNFDLLDSVLKEIEDQLVNG